jgi:Lysophospholipase catalytic domain
MLLCFYLSVLALTGLAYAHNGSITDYAPLVNQPCPDVSINPLLRVFTPQNQSLHPREAEYVNTRLTTVIPEEWGNWVGDGSAIGYNLSAFTSFPKIGLAISGGGLRAAQYGAGVLSALDARNQSAKAAGTGGFLQVSSYLLGLSGASLSIFPLISCLFCSVFFFFLISDVSGMPSGMHVSLACCEEHRVCLTCIEPCRRLMGHLFALSERFPDYQRPRARKWGQLDWLVARPRTRHTRWHRHLFQIESTVVQEYPQERLCQRGRRHVSPKIKTLQSIC